MIRGYSFVGDYSSSVAPRSKGEAKMNTCYACFAAGAALFIVVMSYLPKTKYLVKRSYKRHRGLLLTIRSFTIVAFCMAVAGLITSSGVLVAFAELILIVGLTVALAITVFERIVPPVPDSSLAVLVVAAHPDDLEIACGATVAKLVDQGHDVHALIMADGKDGGEVACRAGEASDGAEFLGLSSLTMLGMPDRALGENMKEMIAAIEAAIARVEPAIIFTHSTNDVHQDHSAVHDAVCRAGRNHHSILCFESPSVTADFKPTVFIDVKDYPTVKGEAIAAHASQTSKPYMTQGVIDSTLQFRGRQGRIPHAEGFEAVRLQLTEPVQLKRAEDNSAVSR